MYFILQFLFFLFQVTEIPIRDSAFVRFNQFSGKEIPNNTIFDIHEDEDGLIWIATQDGFARFEGNQFRFFRHQRNAKNSLHDNICYGITSTKNKLWISTQTGIAEFDKLTLTQTDTLFPEKSFSFIQGFGTEIIAISNNTIFHWDETKTQIDSIQTEMISGISKRDQVFITPKLFVYQKKESLIEQYYYKKQKGMSKQVFHVPDSLTNADVFGYTTDSTLLLRHQNSVTQLRLKENESYQLEKLIHIPQLSQIDRLSSYGLTVNDSNFWISGVNFLGYIQKMEDETYSFTSVVNHSKLANSERTALTFSVLLDHHLQLWIGDQRNGLFLLDLRSFIFKNLSAELGITTGNQSQGAWALDFNADQTKAVFSTDEAVYEISFRVPFHQIPPLNLIQPYIQQFKRIPIPEESAQVIDVVFFNNKFYLNAYKKGIYEYDSETGKLKKVYSQSEANRFYSVSKAGTILVWSGYKQVFLQDSLNRFSPSQPDFFSRKSTIYNATFNRPRNELIFSESNSVIRYSFTDSIINYLLEPERKAQLFGPTAIMNAMGKGNSYWISTFGQGVFFISPDDSLLIGNASGLENTSIYNTVIDSNSMVWISTNRGLHLIDSTLKKVILLNELNGFENTTANQNGTEIHDSDIVSIAGNSGVSLINTKRYSQFNKNVIFPQIIEMIVQEIGKSQTYYPSSHLSNIKLKFSQSNIIRLTIGTSDLIAPNYPKFYRIHPDSVWKTIPDGHFELLLSNLPESNYQIETALINPYNLAFESKALLPFEVFTPFWARLETRLVVSLFIFILFVLIIQKLIKENYHRRLLRLEKEQTQFREREHLSRDLHDSIGTQLSLIIRHLSAASKEVGTNKRLITAKEMAQFSLEQLRETIWALKSEEIHLNEYTHRVEQLCKRLVLNSEIQLQFFAKLTSNPIIPPIQHIQLQRIIEEAVTNAIKYSKSNRLKIEINSTQSFWTIQIQDFGVGFDLQIPSNSTQYGLKHMAERAKLIQSEIELTSEPSIGTRIQLTIPFA